MANTAAIAETVLITHMRGISDNLVRLKERFVTFTFKTWIWSIIFYIEEDIQVWTCVRKFYILLIFPSTRFGFLLKKPEAESLQSWNAEDSFIPLRGVALYFCKHWTERLPGDRRSPRTAPATLPRRRWCRWSRTAGIPRGLSRRWSRSAQTPWWRPIKRENVSWLCCLNDQVQESPPVPCNSWASFEVTLRSECCCKASFKKPAFL